jgi:hypothetical protein
MAVARPPVDLAFGELFVVVSQPLTEDPEPSICQGSANVLPTPRRLCDSPGELVRE